ncbi:MAG TPA: multifunctional oxoglutarate decarboxylase/oxoglutarate dehydrogenase thiamine pyrophosphate-binding subunit/dihydrolipoyllysine-residue succinyltransferase subunit [Actinomycetota bacterium]|nr:multifunctional oxoglutarate decarboxylase/oxoglutarate dehydrogenase thiamine pyrophosphate-binding subunit/dihydrolipoyllysine-residue succinyltransferase subunit [Actinomycetota bacterium]
MAKLRREELGPNTWLVDEMYRQYRDDPSSVSDAWQEFFEDYRPSGDGGAPAEPDAETVTRLGEAADEAVAEAPAPPRPEEAPEAPEEPAEEPAKEPAEEPREKPAEEPAEARKPATEPSAEPLKGIAATIARNMETSLGVPTATSFRTVPAKLLEVNREILNRHLQRQQGGKVSFTHIIGFAVARVLAEMPEMNVTYTVVDGKPHVTRNDHVNLGLAVDTTTKDGQRVLLVPNIKDAQDMDFAAFHRAYEEMINRVRQNKLSPDDFAGTTVTLTNPGTVGTVQSVPRLMAGQAAIIGVGAIGYPAEYKGADPDTLAELGVGKVLTLTSTYDHRVIQGALSGEFLARVEELLTGEGLFYERVFKSMHVPYVAVRWRQDHRPAEGSLDKAEQHMKLRQLINIYRVRGHLIANLDPLEQKPPSMHPELDPADLGFTLWDLDRTFPTGGFGGKREMKLREILRILRDAYCRTLAIEYMHIQEPDQKEWIQQHVEGVSTECTLEDKVRILEKLGEAEALEQFLHTKYLGHKRFSLEGSESLVPMLDAILAGAADEGLPEAVIGMPHRGRLDVLTSIVGKSYADIFRHFEGTIDPEQAQGSGDVKYHIGAEGKFSSSAGNDIKVSVASNPSHLEAVNPVVEGMARARQDLLDRPGDVLPLLMHGDAAFAGQGVVAETLAMSALHGYGNGGTIHIIVNNQLGFTTGSDYGRSSTYSSDVAKMVQAPILHVNGDDPEACVRAARLAFAFRQRFQKDVVIDMWCYRRWGHNEGDDPSFTQPLMYRKIKDLRTIRKRYVEHLVNRGDLSVEEAEEALARFKERLDAAFDQVPRDQEKTAPVEQRPPERIKPAKVETAVYRERLEAILRGITEVPSDFNLHPKMRKGLDQRRESLEKDAVDWSTAEALAWGTLLHDGRTVRLSGQDSRRGTFNQRHSVWVDHETGREHSPFVAYAERTGGRFFAYDSLLSEFAVLGFEYGYSVAHPDALVMWEAQFGDFINEAQVIVDQFIAAAEDKWGQTSGLVLLLPHGYEGQGPEHSSARLERFLELAAEDNMQVAVPSTPAQYFHLLRRQTLREQKKPLIVMTPKSLLRLPAARSAASEFTDGEFRAVLPDPSPPSNVKRVVLCSGKVYYDLAKGREDKPVALVRVEELYPFPEEGIRAELDRHKGADVAWVQDEPENMGAWHFMERNLRRRLGIEPKVVAREESASPATGSLTIHQQEQQKLLRRALSI